VPFALLHGDGRFAVLAEYPLAALDGPDPSGFRFVRSGAVPPIRPDFVGFVAYEFANRQEPLLPSPAATDAAIPIPDFRFVLYGRIRIWDREQKTLYEAGRRAPRALDPRPSLLRPGPFRARRLSDGGPAEIYRAKVERIREEIAEGNVYTRQEAWSYEGNLLTLAGRLAEADPAPHSALIVEPDFAIVGASPESFLHIEDGIITTRPIKGTAARVVDPADDQDAARGLLSSPKNRSELAMIVDLLRNDLTRVCEVPSVRVAVFPQLESYAHVHHLSATVQGHLRADVTLEGLLRATFPGGSVTGCPKLAAMRLIRELEGARRSVYTGALGWFSHDLSQLDLGIVIRTAWAGATELRFGVGGGIVWDSGPADEFLETVHKGASLVGCLS